MLPIKDINEIGQLPAKLQQIIHKELSNCNEPYLLIDNFTPESINHLLEDIESELQEFPKKIKKKTFNITVELIQNIYLHNPIIPKEIPQEYDKFGFYILCKFPNFATKILTGNFVDNFAKDEIESYLKYIRGLSEDELKELFFKIFSQAHNIKGGAGLGFLEISRKCNSNFNFRFINYNLESYLFIFSATVTTEKNKIYE